MIPRASSWAIDGRSEFFHNVLHRGVHHTMRFAKDFSAEVDRLTPLFTAAADADKEFHAAWRAGTAELGIARYKQTDRYEQTLNRFHAARGMIDEIVSTAFIQAKLGDDTQFSTLFAYLALPGRYFRSGYQRAVIWHFVKRLPLDEEQSRILREIVLRQVETAGPEFAEMARAARKVNSAGLQENLRSLLLRSRKNYVVARLKRLLSALESRPN
jgi:hypothetical protein